MTGADRVIRWSTALAVLGVAAVASYEHAYDLVRAHGESQGAGEGSVLYAFHGSPAEHVPRCPGTRPG